MSIVWGYAVSPGSDFPSEKTLSILHALLNFEKKGTLTRLFVRGVESALTELKTLTSTGSRSLTQRFRF